MSEVVVLGMHRSGTSMTAGICHALGIVMYRGGLASSPFNPYGYYEDIDFQRLNIRILADCIGSWEDPPTRDRILEIGEKYREEIQALVTSRKGHLWWGWKDPRTCLTLPLFTPYLKSPKFIVCLRSVKDVAASLHRRNQFTYEKSASLYRYYYHQLYQNLGEKNYRSMLLNYGQTKRKPEQAVDLIIQFLGMTVSSDIRQRAIEHIRK